jgi:hypothetical protein
VLVSKNEKLKIGYGVQLLFLVTQHSRDRDLINKLVESLGCGYVRERSRGSAVDFKVTAIEDIINKIIPFFELYLLQGIKTLDYKDFCKIALLMKDGLHRKNEGIEEIRKIKSGMNSHRKFDSL